MDWRHRVATTGAYVQVLRNWGYDLSDVERQATGEHPTDPTTENSPHVKDGDDAAASERIPPEPAP